MLLRSVADAINVTSRMTICTARHRRTALCAIQPRNGNQHSPSHEKSVQLAGLYQLRAFHRAFHDADFRDNPLYLSSRKSRQLERLANDRVNKTGMAEPAHYFRLYLFNPLHVPPLFYQLESLPLLSEIKNLQWP